MMDEYLLRQAVLKVLIGRFAAATAKPAWTLNANSWLIAAVFVEGSRSPA
jgi:hypothetical protein